VNTTQQPGKFVSWTERAIRSLLFVARQSGGDDQTLLRYVKYPEGRMLTDLHFLEEWIPERMDPGTVFMLENQAKLGNAQNPYVAVMSCPRCGTMGLITRRQLCAGETMICGGDVCSAEYRLDGESILFRPPQ
jgi:hypothetical protein